MFHTIEKARRPQGRRMSWPAGPVAAVMAVAASVLMTGCAHLEQGPAAGSGSATLTIVHTNDTHSHAAGVSPRRAACLDDGRCLGGYARLARAVSDQRAASDDVLVLDAGDTWQGSLFFKAVGPGLVTDFAADLDWDAATLGNHEFDEGCTAAARYVKALPMPVLGANLIVDPQCPLADGKTVLPWVIRRVGGIDVGIVGLINDEKHNIRQACPHTRFLPRRQALQQAADALTARGIRHIVAVTHVGYDDDCELARTVTGIDVIVGGHSHDVLGDWPESVGAYPTRLTAPDGAPVLVVTAGVATEFLGRLKVRFDARGHVEHAEGGLLHLTADLQRDEAVSGRVRALRPTLEAWRGETVAHNAVEMADGLEPCRRGECLGALITTDAMLGFGRPYGAVAALLNAGAVRDAIPVGEVKHRDLLSIHPFGNRVRMREITGGQLLSALEHGVSDDKVIGPWMLHTAGIRYRIDARAPSGRRTHAVQIRIDGRWQDVDPRASYRVVLSDFISEGGDGYDMLAAGLEIETPEIILADLVEASIRGRTIDRPPETGRLVWSSRPAPESGARPETGLLRRPGHLAGKKNPAVMSR